MTEEPDWMPFYTGEDGSHHYPESAGSIMHLMKGNVICCSDSAVRENSE